MAVAYRILLVDDEPALVKGLRRSLEQAGFEVEVAGDGREALERFAAGGIDLIILDIMLPEVDGLTVCREVRKTSQVPIIMLTARDEDVDRIVGLELGADDYVVKPFNPRELIARIRAVLRRADRGATAGAAARAGSAPGAARGAGAGEGGDGEEVLVRGPLRIDRARYRVTVDGRPVELTPREFELLVTLAQRPGRVFTREQLLEQVWGYHYAGDTRAVDVAIRRLRERLEPDPAHPVFVRTKWGVGYYFADPEEMAGGQPATGGRAGGRTRPGPGS
ncbi:MAG: DNA-binding response regulator [Bacillota bacterium]|nr:MAG: DNA-binding response regulator [Bacillota bacterium]